MTSHEYREECFEPLREKSALGDVLDAVSLEACHIHQVLVLDLAGALDGTGSIEFSNRIQLLLRRGERIIVVNLKAVTMVDSTGLGEIVRSFTAVARSGGRMPLVNPPSHFSRLIQQAKFL